MIKDYKLGSLIRFVDERNCESRDLPLFGINLNKEFFPSVANIVGTDLSKYRILKEGMFACNLMHVGRDAKVPIALHKGDDAIISPAYPTFEVKDCKVILPEFLMLLFKREVFDAEAEFFASAGIRGGFEIEDFLNVMLPVPPIEEQRRIVAEYQTVERRIANNEAMIQRLEETAQAIYHHTFVEGIDENILPKGWRKGRLEEIAFITMGQSPDGDSYNEDGCGCVFYQGRTDFGNRFPTVRMFTTEPSRYAECGDILMSVRAPVGDLNIAVQSCCIGRGLAAIREKRHRNSFLFYLLQSKENVFKQSDSEGTIFGSINKDDLFGLPIIIPDDDTINLYDKNVRIVDNYIINLSSENNNLIELKSLLTSKIS